MDGPITDVPPHPAAVASGTVERPRISRRRLLWLGTGAAVLVGGACRVLTNLGGFRINEVETQTPVFNPATFQLTVDGAVQQPLTLSWEQLLALPAVSQVSDFHCVEGWGVKDVRWQGVRLQTLADLVKPVNPSFITFHSLGGVYRDSLSIDQALLPDTLLAYHMYEQPLTPPHGRPLRLIVPQMYGYKGPKWLTRVEFTGQRVVGYWEQRGWQIDGWRS
ncbi:MAG TPA: molybdopterin-dependent oxidoreductase [Dehalococcoidia bacterium]|nr:molybdopterin-dependent oxidoreductase [Dehalococcoidia bacterium]